MSERETCGDDEWSGERVHVDTRVTHSSYADERRLTLGAPHSEEQVPATSMRHHVLLALAALAPACQYDPYTNVYTTQEPAAKDVMGNYGRDEATGQWSRYSKAELRRCRVELRSDGTFVATHVPTGFDGTLSDRTGQWSIDIVAGNEHEKYWGVRYETSAGEVFSSHLSGDGSPYGMIFTLGDADAGEAILLERRDV